jgi:hypothetical protein
MTGHEHEPSPTPSGTTTPSASFSSASYLPSVFPHAVTGFLRRFSSDPPLSTSPQHASTFPIPNSKNSPSHGASQSHSTTSSMDGVYTPPYRNASPAPFQPPPLYPLSLKGYLASSAPTARLLSSAIAEEIRLLVPPRLQLGEEWNLVYSLEQDGVSLGTLYKKCEDLRGLRNGFVLVIKDGEGGVCPAFSCHLSCYQSG